MASCEYGEGMAFGSEAAAGGFDPATSNRQIPAHLAIATPPREARSSFSNPCYMNYEYCEKRVLRVASITSTKKRWEQRSRRAASNPRPPTNKSLRT
jgi:hypothetical protein